MDDPGAGGASRFLTFRLRGQLYALPADEVSEVIRMPAVARIPQGPRELLGLGNLRGSVLPVASGRGLLKQEDAEASLAIVLHGATPVAVAVDKVEALVSVEQSRIAAGETELPSEPGERVRGAFQVAAGEEVAKILDVWPLLEAAFLQAPRTSKASAAAIAARTRGEDEDGAGAGTERLVTFEAADQEFGLPLGEVREIIPLPATVARMPRTEALVIGVTAYREALLPILSLRGLLDLPAAEQLDGRSHVLVVRFGGALAGIVVDRVRSILTADSGHIEPTPAVISARTSGESRIRAIYRGQGGRRLVSILSKDQLFREDVMDRLAKSAEVSQPVAAEGGEAGQDLRFLVFRLGDEEFALPIEAVVEVARVPEQITRVPRTPQFLEGVINLRGEVLPVVDQRRRFDLPPAANRDARRLIVVRTEEQRAGLIVDGVSEVLRASTDAIEPAPDLTGESTRLVQAVLNLVACGRLVLLLDPAELLTRAERGLLEAFQTDDRQASL